jgi:dethiobiotin synthetase/adenosylmethionine--8-amino-7-oxononanoate aminotransferase
MGFTIVETAGGVLSPGPSGVPQADLFRPLRMPVVLVADHRLGGIASTISAAESLILRGYDIDIVFCFDDHGKYKNSEYLGDYFKERGISFFKQPWIPDVTKCNKQHEYDRMKRYYKQGYNHPFNIVSHLIMKRHSARLATIDSLASRTQHAIWHPFTQHKSIEKAEDISVFDSAYGDYFQTKQRGQATQSEMHSIRSEEHSPRPVFYPAFDGSASWWTQGLGHGNPKLSLAAAYAAGRYGHIMFAGATHEPAIHLAEKLLKELNNRRLTKCFYSDDGSTAAEVGIKMALRASCKHYGWDSSSDDIGILGLKGSYHGDTIGAMDASEPCVYNKKVDWYRGRGYWFDYPTVKMRDGKWVVEPPVGMEQEFGQSKFFDTLNDVFEFEKRRAASFYDRYITSVLDKLVKEQGRKFGGLVMEPIILGAGGMVFVDPLFQHVLVQAVRNYSFGEQSSPLEGDLYAWEGLPVMFDEVFTGLYRLGRFSAASFLHTNPDISIHAKLLTGGLLPLSVTLASQSIFDTFLSDEKADALLHGHSYTAHPIGCHVANTSLGMMKNLSKSDAWKGFKEDWRDVTDKEEDEETLKSTRSELSSRFEEFAPKLFKTRIENNIWSMWNKHKVTKLSSHKLVDHVIAIGSVLAVKLKDDANSGQFPPSYTLSPQNSHNHVISALILPQYPGYTSTAAIGLRDALLNDSSFDSIHIHSRVLGNVVYLMASMTSTPKDLAAIEDTLMARLDGMGGVGVGERDVD